MSCILPYTYYFSERPHKVDVVRKNTSDTLVNWSHSLSKEVKFHQDLEYIVVEVNGSSEETELEGNWKEGQQSMIVKGRHGRHLKVGVRFKDDPKLGIVYSDPYIGKHMHTNAAYCLLYIFGSFHLHTHIACL